MGEIVKYHNDLNTVIMRTWTAEEMNFFFAILSKAKEHGVSKLIFDTDELKELVNFSQKNRQRWEETMKSCARKVAQLVYYEETEQRFRVMTMFSIFDVWIEKGIVEIELSQNFDYILNKLEAQFTRYELAEFTNIRSTYAKTMYRLLKQWRTVGSKAFSIEDLKRLLDTPSSYRPSEIDRLILTPILKELSQFFPNLKVKKVKSNKRGNPVIAYEFTWQAEKIKNVPRNKKETKKISVRYVNSDDYRDFSDLVE